MNNRDELGKSAAISPQRVAERVLLLLEDMYKEMMPNAPKGDFFLNYIGHMLINDEYTGDALYKILFGNISDEESHVKRLGLPFATLLISCAYCMQAIKASMSQNSEKAWEFAGMGQYWAGLMLGLRGGEQDIAAAIKEGRSAHAKKGAKARDAKYQPIREYVYKLAKEGRYPSRNNAANRIAPVALEFAKANGIHMSPDQATKTIADWLKEAGIPFASKRSIRTSKDKS